MSISKNLSRFRLLIVSLCLALVAAVGVPSQASAYTWTANQEAYVRAVLAPHIAETVTNRCGTYTLPDTHIVTETTYETCWLQVVQVTQFLEWFGDAIPDEAPPSSGPAPIYDELVYIDKVIYGGSGWTEATFDVWKAEGLIN